MTRICTVNVKYSANLGDGVIAECIEYAMLRFDPQVQVEAIDLAGRRDFGDGLDGSRARILALLDRLPRPLRRVVVGGLLRGLVHIRLRPRWREQLRGCDAAVLGGGQLLADADLNFPIKVGSCLDLAARAGLPTAIYAVGCGGAWSAAGRRLFRAAMAKSDIRAFMVRDCASRRRVEAEFAQSAGGRVDTCPDPAVLVHETYGIPLHRPGPVRRVGLCVAHPGVLSLHADAGQPAVPLSELYLGVARILVDRGLQPVFFTNGAGEDDMFLRDVLAPRIDEAGLNGSATMAPRPTLPRDLVALIGGFDAVVAHRLHASIIAYGLRIPHVGLNWDSKVRHFFNEVGRQDFLVEAADTRPQQVVDRLDAALAEGIDHTVWQQVLDRSHASIADLLGRLLHRVPANDQVRVGRQLNATP